MAHDTRVERGTARRRILDAAVDVIRRKGLNATTVDDLCAAAGVTKGAFFHHFESKEALAVAAAQHWSAITGALFAAAEYHNLPDPADRVFGYIDFRATLISDDLARFTCLVGTMAQEAYLTYPEIREAAAASIFGHAATLEADIAAALANAGAPAELTASSLAHYLQVVLQGSFVVSKAADDPDVAREAIAHVRRYFECILNHRPKENNA
jgi:TetR/AcrR family transcriptional repressor of nem operon